MRSLLCCVPAWVAFSIGCKSREPAPPPSEPTAAVPAEGPPRLYGYWGLNGFVSSDGLPDVQRRLGATVFHTASRAPGYTLKTLLPMARAAGMKVTLRITGDHQHYTDADGNFDLTAWKAALQPWAEADLAEFIADGTLHAHMLLDDIHNFEGNDPTGDELDEMARISKVLLPGLPTFVREKATAMPTPSAGRYAHVDAIVNQYRHREGDVTEWTAAQVDHARALDVGLIHGLNIANGGDGSSGQPGWQEGRFAMSADEIRTYGAVLAGVPEVSMFLNWEYDGEEKWSDGSVGSAWFDRPELTAALVDVGEQVKATTGPPLLRVER
jgi:hypothetical protein